MSIYGAIILAAGKGTRMKSSKAKVTYHLADQPLIQRVVNVALDIGCGLVTVVVGYKKEDVIDCLTPHPELRFVEQKEQKGTGHAVMVTQEMFQDFEGDVLILCGDVPLLTRETLQQLLDVHKQNKSSCTVLTVKLDDPGKYGRIVRSQDGTLQKIVEYKDASEKERTINEINSGIYCFKCQDLFQALSSVNSKNKQNEYYLTDTLEILREKGKSVNALVTGDVHEVSGINSQQQLACLESLYYEKIKNYWLNNGVTIENPDTVIIGDQVQLSNDVHISAGTIIKGDCKVGYMTHIGPNTYIKNSTIEENTVIDGFNIILDAKISCKSHIKWGEKLFHV